MLVCRTYEDVRNHVVQALLSSGYQSAPLLLDQIEVSASHPPPCVVMAASSSSHEMAAGARDMQHEGPINPISPPRRGDMVRNLKWGYVEGGPNVRDDPDSSTATLNPALDRDLQALKWSTQKSVVDVLDRFFADASATLPPSSHKIWSEMQTSQMYMTQPGDHREISPGTDNDERIAWIAHLRKMVITTLEVFAPTSVVGYQAAEPCPIRDLHICRLLEHAGVLSPKTCFSSTQWASLCSMGAGDELTASRLSTRCLKMPRTTVIVSDSSIILYSKQQWRHIAAARLDAVWWTYVV